MKDKFYNLLPNEFTRKEAIEIAAKLNIKPRTADKYLYELIHHYFQKTLCMASTKSNPCKVCDLFKMSSKFSSAWFAYFANFA
ncbi:MAG: hypothetical protein EHM93_09875 [Bacteroidales bacterium]|nr:MAG: hypothetical protein EHM93_09875 [Bacteroidales bacterium]